MRIKLTIDDTEHAGKSFFSENEGRITLTQTFGEDEKGEIGWPVYTEFVINYGDDMPTWTDNVRQVVKALEKHYGYSFDLNKLVKKGKLNTEDPDHGD